MSQCFAIAMLLSAVLLLPSAVAQKYTMLTADNAMRKWAHTTGVSGSGIQYDLPRPIALKAPEGATILLRRSKVSGTAPDVLNTGRNAIDDLEAFLRTLPVTGGGYGDLQWTTPDGHVWDYWAAEFYAFTTIVPTQQPTPAPGEKPPTPTLPFNGAKVTWAHTTGVVGSGMQYDLERPIQVVAPPGGTILISSDELDAPINTGRARIDDLEAYVKTLPADNGRGYGDLFWMTEGPSPHIWDYWSTRFYVHSTVVSTPTPAPTARPSAKPTPTPTTEPSAQTTPTPTAEPSAQPTHTQTAEPSARPTPAPTSEPTAPQPAGTVDTTLKPPPGYMLRKAAWGSPSCFTGSYSFIESRGTAGDTIGPRTLEYCAKLCDADPGCAGFDHMENNWECRGTTRISESAECDSNQYYNVWVKVDDGIGSIDSTLAKFAEWYEAVTATLAHFTPGEIATLRRVARGGARHRRGAGASAAALAATDGQSAALAAPRAPRFAVRGRPTTDA